MSSPSHPCFCAYNRTMDLRTPRNVKLTAFFRRSFAFRTVRDRLPIILTKIIDTLSQNKNEIAKVYGHDAQDDLKTIMGKLSRLKYEIQTNKPLKQIRSKAPDAAIYNEYIRETDGQEGTPTPFHTVWLLVECYMYRKIWEAFERTKCLQEFDPFRFGKEELFTSAIPQIKETVLYLQKITNTSFADKDEFFTLLEMNLWSNKCDLSLNPDGVQQVLRNQISELSANIIINDCEKVWKSFQKAESDIVDIIIETVGPSLIADFALADYLLSKGLCKKVNFHVKLIPWNLSGAVLQDVKWTIEQLSKMYEEPMLQSSGETWLKYLDSQHWVIKPSDFWTLPVDFSMMHKYNRLLYEDLADSKMIFIKGDANYRKIFREIYHNPETSKAEAQGYFGPAKLCALRRIESEIICGAPKGLTDKYEEINKKWMQTGEYAVIQHCDKIVPLIVEDQLNRLTTCPTRRDSTVSAWSPDLGTKCLCRN